MISYRDYNTEDSFKITEINEKKTYTYFGKYSITVSIDLSDNRVKLTYPKKDDGKEKISFNDKRIKDWVIDVCENHIDSETCRWIGKKHLNDWYASSDCMEDYTAEEFLKYTFRILKPDYSAPLGRLLVYCWLEKTFENRKFKPILKQENLATRLIIELPRLTDNIYGNLSGEDFVQFPVINFNTTCNLFNEPFPHKLIRLSIGYRKCYSFLDAVINKGVERGYYDRKSLFKRSDVKNFVRYAAKCLAPDMFIWLYRNCWDSYAKNDSDWIITALNSNLKGDKEDFFSWVLIWLDEKIIIENYNNKNFVKNWKKIFQVYPQLVEYLERKLCNYDLVHHLGLVLDISEAEGLSEGSERLASSLEGYIEEIAKKSGKNSEDYLVTKAVLVLFKNNGAFYEVQLGNGKNISMCTYFERQDAGDASHVRGYLFIKDLENDRYWALVCDGGHRGFQTKHFLGILPKWGIMLCEMSKEDFKKLPLENNGILVNKDQEIENLFNLEYIDHLIEDHQTVGNCSVFSMMLLLQALFPLLTLHYQNELLNTKRWKKEILNSERFTLFKAFHVKRYEGRISLFKKLTEKKNVKSLDNGEKNELETVLKAAKEFKPFPSIKAQLNNRNMMKLGKEVLAYEVTGVIAGLLAAFSDYVRYGAVYLDLYELKRLFILLQSFIVVIALISWLLRKDD